MEFPATLEALIPILDYIRGEVLHHAHDPSLLHRIELACEEVVVNIISYAYKNEKGSVYIECSKSGSRFEILFRDRGEPFDPIDAEINPQLDEPVHKRKVGGMGLFLVRKIIDEVCYQREGDENILRLSFNL